MTQPAPPPDTTAADTRTAAVAGLLASTTTAAGLVAGLALLLRLPVPTARALLALTPAAAAVELGMAGREVAAQERIFRAAYLTAAAGRVAAAVAGGQSVTDAIRAEAQHAQAHRQAAGNRAAVARQVDGQASRFGPVLGWYARRDTRTSAECLAADGLNFAVGRRPAIGYPGSVHPHCRCRAGAPHVGAGWVGVATATSERKAAVA